MTDGAERRRGRRGTGSPPEARHRLSITVYGEDVDVLDAVAVTSGQEPQEAAAALLVLALDRARQDPEVAAALAARRRWPRRRRLEVVPPDSLDADPRDHSTTDPKVCPPVNSREVIAIEAVASFDPDALRRLRQAKKLSHDGLAERVGIARPNLIAYEQGRKRPSPKTLRALAAALGADPMRLLTASARTATLADLRAAKAGLTTTETAAALGIARHTYDRIEGGRRPLDGDLAERLAALLGVAPGTVLAAHRRGSGAQA
ncbi:MAG: helix-turn-helix domain-containing protein [Acidimicrobiales bacterium]